MATNKIGLTKLGLKKNTNLINLEWNGQIIEIKEYLPVEEKLKVVEKIVNQSLDDNNFANPARIQINTILEILFAYTNINFTEKQKEDKAGLYDLLVSSGLADAIFKALNNTDEVRFINTNTREIIDEVYKYKNSALGILQAVTADYQNLDLDATKLQEKLANKENVEFLKEVMDKINAELHIGRGGLEEAIQKTMDRCYPNPGEFK